jgi:DNA-binding CsgD family transcriptional regulator
MPPRAPTKDNALLLRQSARLRPEGDFGRAEPWRWTLEASGRAVLGLDACGRVLAVSQAAERHLGAVLRIRNGALEIGDPALRPRLSALVDAAIKHDPGRPNGMPPPLGIRLGSGRMLHIDVLPLPPDVTPPRRIVALLFLRETGDGGGSLAETLRQRFGLTPAESRLALALADGMGLREAADRNGVRLSTARVQLKAIFWKTETHRQAELVALLARLD